MWQVRKSPFCSHVSSFNRAALSNGAPWKSPSIVAVKNARKTCCAETFAFRERRSFANQDKSTMRPYVRQERTSRACPWTSAHEHVTGAWTSGTAWTGKVGTGEILRWLFMKPIVNLNHSKWSCIMQTNGLVKPKSKTEEQVARGPGSYKTDGLCVCRRRRLRRIRRLSNSV